MLMVIVVVLLLSIKEDVVVEGPAEALMPWLGSLHSPLSAAET